MIKYLLPGTATTNTSVLRPETLGSTLLLAVFVTIVPSSVTTAVAVTLRSANRSWPSRASSLFVGCRDNFSREVQPFTEVLDTLGCDGVVVVLPRELGLDETLGCQTLEGFDDFEIWNVEIFMFQEVVILLSNQYALLEEIFVDDAAVLF